MNVPFLQNTTFTGLVSTDEYYTSKEWGQAYDFSQSVFTNVQSNSGGWEQAYNIATFYSQNSAILIEQTTFSTLTSLKANNQLKTGQLYQINDFQLMWWSHCQAENIILSSGVIEPLLVLAISANQVSQEAYSALHPNDIVYYDIDARTSYSWNSGPNNIPNFKGWIYRRVYIPKNIDIAWDWRYITNNCCRYDVSNIPTYSFSTNYNKYEVVVVGSTYYLSTQDNNIGNNINSNSWRNIGLNANTYYPTLENGESNFYESVLGLIPLSSTRAQFYTFSTNTTTPGTRPNIEQYSRVSNIKILTNNDKQGNTVFVIGTSLVSIYDSVYIGPWCLNNYFTGGNQGTYNSSFGVSLLGNIFGPFVINNIIGNNMRYNLFAGSQQFTDNIINNNFENNFSARAGIGGFFAYNSVQDECKNNIFGNNIRYNIIGRGFTENVFQTGFENNQLGNDIKNNFVDSSFVYNSIKNTFQNNTLGTNFVYNNIGNNSTNNIIGDYCSFNNIQNNFGVNTIGTDFSYNDIGNTFDNNTIGSIFQFNNINNEFQNNTTSINFIKTNVANSITNINFTGATHVYNSYDKNLFLNFDSIARLSFFNSNDQLVVTDPTS